MYNRPPFNNRNNHRNNHQPPQQPQQPPQPYLNQLNYLLNNFYNQQQQPNYPIPNPNPNPNITTQYFNPPIESSYNHVHNNNRHVLIERIDKAAAKARRELVARSEYVSVMKVSQEVLLALESCSWDALGVQMNHVPALYSLIMIEGKINTFINCFIRVWKVTTLADLEAAICKNEGVQQFEELELGPLIRHPLINDYFCVSPDSTRAFEISSQEVLNYLVEFMDANRGAEIKADELLDFIAKERSVDSKEKIHVRIQSLGLHISFIKQAKPMEVATIKKYITSSDKKSKKRPLFTSQKKQLDDNFSVISQRIKSFSTEHVNKHIRFNSSSEDDDDVEDNDDDIESDDNEDEACLTSQSKNSSQEMKTCDRVSRCPYPSAIEEKTRLGILGEKEESPSLDNNEGKNRSNIKRKADAIDSTSNVSRKSPKGGSDKQGYVGINLSKKVHCKGKHPADMSLDNDSMMTFITLWKDRCKGKDVFKVLKQMTRFYKSDMPKIPKKLSRELYKSYPLVGLINVAIRSIKRGMWDSMYDTLQDSMYDTLQALEQGEAVKDSMDHTDNVTIETEQTDTQLVNKHASKQRCEASIEDILKKVSEYLKDNHDVSSDSNSVFGRNAFFHRNLFKCEVWVTQQFAVENFESFGYGDFLTFLEKKVSELPSFVQKYLGSNGTHDKPSLKASMSHQLLDLLVAQASYSLSEKESLSIQNVSELLTMQFPLIPFSIDKDGSQKALEDIVKSNKSNPVSKSVLFSAALLSPHNVNSSSETHISSKDAIEVLLRAPMLEDLNKWSHWDVLFAPSLGPLTIWLLNETNTKELLCLVTRSGNVIRIDHTATVDSFLEASIRGCPFRTALNLLSLFVVYGGEKKVPSSLLKCHLEKAFKVIVNNKDQSEDKSEHNTGIVNASKFVLECLAYLPTEFRCFATNLLLSGFRSIVKDAASAILSQCRHEEDRVMLHEIGLSLGIMEWINDYKSKKSSGFDQEKDMSTSPPANKKGIISTKVDGHRLEGKVGSVIVRSMGVKQRSSTSNNEEDSAKKIIESIRREEFGLDPSISTKEDSILKKQHARLGRALHCLSQELYSQDSHFLLELVQNADDNMYPCDVEPTLTFILQEASVIVLNNEQGFSAENIKALCDVGNSTKKEPSAGYIGKKGIGFKSVFRVTDAPEIHSNGFHIKFDISDGQIGFVLPTVVQPCNIDMFGQLVSVDSDTTNEKRWNTCIVLPFRSKKKEGFSVENLISLFSDLHPSLLLFLHRLECIKFRNLLNDSLVVMRKEVVGDGIVNVTVGQDKMTWFVKSHKLQSDHIRHDVQTTEISMALMLEVSDNGYYNPKLEHQPVFAFLPLRNYGLKFIIQADFILPSSREEVDGDSPWNQWLLSEFPNLFVSAELSFCSLPCFSKSPAKGISVFMSFVPLVGEVHGFFSCLPRMIISKLRTSNCLLLEGDSNEWVLPCKVLRNWTEQTRSILPDNLMKEHLGIGYLNKDTVLTDSLARALGIEECGPKVLIQIMQSLGRAGSLKSMGLSWLSSWLNVLFSMSVSECQSDIISSLNELPFIPLLDGNYGSIDEGAIWLHTDPDHGLEAFGNLYSKLRIVNPALFNDSHAENITQMLYKVGVQRLSAHEVLKVHILPAICDEKVMSESTELMIEYLSFIMFHLESSCPECLVEKEHILSRLRNNAFISTNHGYKRLVDVPIHFSKKFGNPVDMSKLVGGTDMKWFEIDTSYLKHPAYKSSPGGKLKWRKFLQELGVTDFVQMVEVEKLISDIPHTVIKNMMLDDDCISYGSIIKDYDSEELMHLLSIISSHGDGEKAKYLMEVLDKLWDDYFSDKITGLCIVNGQNKPFKSSILRHLGSSRWMASSIDDQLHFPNELFHSCEVVCSVLGDNAPYAVPKGTSVKLITDIGLKNTVNLDDALSALGVWRRTEKPFRASISQMSKFYTYIWNEMSTSKQMIMESLLSEAFIFVPYSFSSTSEVVSGLFLSPNEVYWHDSTGSMEQKKSTHPMFDQDMTHHPFSKMLCNVYPGLHYFFVNEFGVAENPPLLSYLESLQQLASESLPSQVAKTVFQVFQKWSDGLDSGILSCDDIDFLKKKMEEKEMRILPTVQDLWVSLHQSLGLICWCDDDKLKKEFKNLKNVDFLCLGDLTTEEKQMLQDKVSVLFRRLGIPSLSEVVTREAIYYGPSDSSFKTSLVSWALPFAQRYIYSIHPNEYAEFKLSGFKNLNSLKIVVVEKLFYKNVIKKFGIQSTKRRECCCLLQDNILYATRESDTHSLFMELSRFLVAKNPELHLANFLHMITTMAESGSTEEQMESFVTVNQNLSKLPTDEPQWTISIPSPEEDNDIPATSSCLSLEDLNRPKAAKKFNNSSWPPVNWKSAPGFEHAVNTKAFGNPNPHKRRDVTEGLKDQSGLIESDADQMIEENPASTIPSVILEEEQDIKDQSDSGMVKDSSEEILDNGKGVVSAAATGPNKPKTSSSNLINTYQLNWGTVTPQQVITGRTGELVAFQYFAEIYGVKSVKWVNEVKESGLPFDIIIEGENNSKEYIEVKSTTHAHKDWFVISVKEWEFAVEQGGSFTIARVLVSNGNLARITTYRNPVKLCKSRHLQLAILSSQ